MKQFEKLLIALLLLVSPNVVRTEETDDTPKKTIQFPSPDGKSAFRYSGGKGEDEKQTYELIEKASGKVVKKVAESDPDLGASARFSMENVLWRADSKAFALVATLMKRGSSLFVFRRNGSIFREVKLPRLSAEIPDKVKKGKNLDHVSELSSQRRETMAKRRFPRRRDRNH